MAEREIGSSVVFKLIFAAVAVILGVALLTGAVVPQVLQSTSLTAAPLETWNYSTGINPNGTLTNVPSSNYTVTNAPTAVWQNNGQCPVVFNIVSASNATNNYTFTLNTDYKAFPNLGVLQIINTTKVNSTGTGNTANVSYNYCGPNYINNSFGQTTLNLVPGFFALALLGVGLWLFYGVAREMNIV
jgi:hypothetical protein